MREVVKVMKCPHCGDMWILKEEYAPAFCHCFRCEKDYSFIPTVRMWKWVYDLCKTVKGN